METGEGYPEGYHEEATTREEGLDVNLVDDETITEESFEDDPGKRIVFWADKAIKDYFAIFENSNIPRYSKIEKKLAADHVDKIAQEIVNNPSYIQEGAYLWLLYDQEKDRDQDKNENEDEDENENKEDQYPSFYEGVKKAAGKKIRKDIEKGKELPHETLAGIISASVNSDEANEFADHLLKSYFGGHKGMRSGVDAMYNLSMAGYDLLEDRAALEKAIRIGFWDTEILKRGSGFHKDISIAKIAVNDGEMLRKIIISDLANLSLMELTQIDFTEIVMRNYDVSQNIEEKIGNYADRISSKIGKDNYRVKINELKAFWDVMDPVKQILQDDKPLGIGINNLKSLESLTWINGLLNKKDALLDKNKELALINTSTKLDAGLKEKMLEEGRDPSSLIHKTVVASNGDRFELYLPELDESSNLTNTINEAINELTNEDIDFDRNTSWLHQEKIHEDTKSGAFYYRRAKSEFEKDLHPISAISEIGFIDVDEEKRQETEETAEFIKNNQLRFLNKRGVMIPTDSTVLEDLGYTGSQFNKGDSSQEINMTVHYANEAYSVKMDKNFNFMLEGKDADPNTLYSLQYVALKMLKPILCEQHEESLSLDQSAGKEAVSRMSHLRLLPEGYHYTKEAVKNCFELEGRDLRTIDASRKAKGETRDTTYVRPIIEKDEDLPPVKITIPDLSL